MADKIATLGFINSKGWNISSGYGNDWCPPAGLLPATIYNKTVSYTQNQLVLEKDIGSVYYVYHYLTDGTKLSESTLSSSSTSYDTTYAAEYGYRGYKFNSSLSSCQNQTTWDGNSSNTSKTLNQTYPCIVYYYYAYQVYDYSIDGSTKTLLAFRPQESSNTVYDSSLNNYYVYYGQKYNSNKKACINLTSYNGGTISPPTSRTLSSTNRCVIYYYQKKPQILFTNRSSSYTSPGGWLIARLESNTKYLVFRVPNLSAGTSQLVTAENPNTVYFKSSGAMVYLTGATWNGSTFTNNGTSWTSDGTTGNLGYGNYSPVGYVPSTASLSGTTLQYTGTNFGDLKIEEISLYPSTSSGHISGTLGKYVYVRGSSGSSTGGSESTSINTYLVYSPDFGDSGSSGSVKNTLSTSVNMYIAFGYASLSVCYGPISVNSGQTLYVSISGGASVHIHTDSLKLAQALRRTSRPFIITANQSYNTMTQNGYSWSVS